MELVDANCEIILRDENLEDVGEITEFIKFDVQMRLNDVSSWQLDMSTAAFNRCNDNGGIKIGHGIMFLRDGNLIFDGPVVLIEHDYIAGGSVTTIYGADDLIYLKARICYPVVEGMIFENGCWRFGIKRVADGLSTTLVKDTAVGDTNITVANASGFQTGATITFGSVAGESRYSTTVGNLTATITGVDASQNLIGISIKTGVITAGTSIVQTGTNAIIDDPAYLGYDTRSGPAEKVIKELAYFNAGPGACVDHFGPRAWPHLVVAPSAGGGSQITINSRGDNLLSQIQAAALAGSLWFRAVQKEDKIVFDTFKGSDLTTNDDLVFSTESGNLKEYKISYGLPNANFLLGVGPQSGPDKFMLPSANKISISQFGRWEGWESGLTSKAGANNLDILLNMIATNNLALSTNAYNSTVACSLQETDQVRFPRDFNVGDKIRVMVGEEPSDQIVTNIAYSIPAGSSSGMGSAITAFSMKQMSQLMTVQNKQGDLIRQILMNW